MSGVSNNPNLDLQRLQGTQTNSKSAKPGAFQQNNQDSRLNMNNSVFGPKSSNNQTSGLQGNYSASDGKRIEADSKQQSASATSDMNTFIQTAAGFQVDAQGDMKDSEKIGKDLAKETKSLNKGAALYFLNRSDGILCRRYDGSFYEKKI